MRWFLAFVVAGLAVGGCTSQPVEQSLAGVVPDLSTVSELPRSTSDAGDALERNGAQFLPTLHNRVAAAGSLGHYTPVVGPAGTLDEVAFASYQFDGTGLTGPASLDVLWHAGADPAEAYLGLSNWITDTWEWRALLRDVTSIAFSEIADYIEDADGRLYCVVVVSSGEADLASLRFRQAESGPRWHLTQLSATPGPVHHLHLFEFEGRPAVVYWRDGREEDPPTNRIVLKRALDPDGELWGPPQIVAEIPLTTLGDMPPVRWLGALINDGMLTVYYEAPRVDDQDGMQIRAADLAADAFYSPEPIYTDSDWHDANKLMLVDGRAAFFSDTLNDSILDYAVAWDHADNAIGSEWGRHKVTESNWSGRIWESLLTGSGLPAMVSLDYWDHYGEVEDPPPGSEGVFVRYRRAAGPDPATDGWLDPVTLFHDNTPSLFEALTLADGRPAFLYAHGSTFAWQAALDEEGDSWPVVGLVVPGFGAVASMEAETIGGLPALAYTETSPEALYYRQGADSMGVAWDDPQTVYTGIVDGPLRLVDFGARPAIATLLPATAAASYPAFFIYR